MTAAAITGDSRTKILIVDPQPLTREALARVIAETMAREALARIMMEAGAAATEVVETDGLLAAEGALAVHTDVTLVVLEIELPDARGTEAIERILGLRPGLPILVLSAQDDPATARAALDAGARGFISKRSPTRVLVEALRLVLVGGMYVPPQALRAPQPPERIQSAADGSGGGPDSPAFKSLALTPRQRDVLALLMQGKPNKTICRELSLAEGTVKTHTAAIYRALGVTNRTQAVYAMNRLGVEMPAVARRNEPAPAAAAPREGRLSGQQPARTRVAADTLRTVTSRLQAAAAEGGGRWAAMLGLQPV